MGDSMSGSLSEEAAELLGALLYARSCTKQKAPSSIARFAFGLTNPDESRATVDELVRSPELREELLRWSKEDVQASSECTEILATLVSGIRKLVAGETEAATEEERTLSRLTVEWWFETPIQTTRSAATFRGASKSSRVEVSVTSTGQLVATMDVRQVSRLQNARLSLWLIDSPAGDIELGSAEANHAMWEVTIPEIGRWIPNAAKGLAHLKFAARESDSPDLQIPLVVESSQTKLSASLPQMPEVIQGILRISMFLPSIVSDGKWILEIGVRLGATTIWISSAPILNRGIVLPLPIGAAVADGPFPVGLIVGRLRATS